MLKRLWTRITSINVPLAAAAVFASGILHILATLATPMLTPTSAYGRLAGDLPENSMELLPDITPDTQPLPFMSSDARYAMCRFDTTDGAVSITAVLPDPGWVLALYSPAGDNFFTSVAGPGRRPEVSLLIVPGESAWRPAVQPDANLEGTALTLHANEGLAVLRAPDRGEAYSTRALAQLKRAKCHYRRTAAR
ncbi:MAG: hypothetical protein K2Y42_02535 [Hyphomicrobium sp.]|jgi:uncharacterized membrane protein|uniref:hypothetical protein n=1 Tax=Hyphomicrobium sp. TaxID=82 RepID=UPI0025BBC4F4|nr:hypothetical protein [Hyphomicrobium sp.]MBX9861607.1 hypothetical protein [Hyphomicrobium sp.]